MKSIVFLPICCNRDDLSTSTMIRIGLLSTLLDNIWIMKHEIRKKTKSFLKSLIVFRNSNFLGKSLLFLYYTLRRPNWKIRQNMPFPDITDSSFSITTYKRRVIWRIYLRQSAYALVRKKMCLYGNWIFINKTTAHQFPFHEKVLSCHSD